MESTSFLFNGCGSPYASCLFHRNYLVPTTSGGEAVFDYFHCPNWEFYITAEITLKLPGREPVEERLQLYNGFTFNWKMANLSLTPVITGRPATPIMGGKFISNWEKAAIVPDLPRDLYCPTEVDAVHLLKDCKLAVDACPICRPNHDSGIVRCHCRELDLEQYIRDPQAVLPQPAGQLMIHYEDGEILTRTPYIPVIITAKMEGMHLITQNIKAKCTVEPLSLKGCYKCPTAGARFNYKCTSNHRTQLAEVHCDDGANFFAHCSANGTEDSIILSFSQPNINTLCIVKCGADDTSFKLEGKLNYIVRKNNELGISGKIYDTPSEGFGRLGLLPGVLDFFMNFNSIGIIIAVSLVGIFAVYLFLKFNPAFRTYRLLTRLILLIYLMGTARGEKELYEAIANEAISNDNWELEVNLDPLYICILLAGLSLLILVILHWLGFPDRLIKQINSLHRAARLAQNSQLRMATLEEAKNECAICLEGLSGILRSINCGHTYHKNCVDEWLADHSTCPYCRSDIGLDLIVARV